MPPSVIKDVLGENGQKCETGADQKARRNFCEMHTTED
jgi:hypothetical protein